MDKILRSLELFFILKIAFWFSVIVHCVILGQDEPQYFDNVLIALYVPPLIIYCFLIPLAIKRFKKDIKNYKNEKK